MILTFFEWRSLVLLESLDGDGLESDPGSRVLLQYVPHVLFAEHEKIGVADRPDARCSTVTCVRLSDLTVMRLSTSSWYIHWLYLIRSSTCTPGDFFKNCFFFFISRPGCTENSNAYRFSKEHLNSVFVSKIQ